MTEHKTYYKYWGKAKRPIEVDYCYSDDTDVNIAAHNNISLDELLSRAHKYGWQKSLSDQKRNSYHLLVYHSLDVAAVAKSLLEQHHFLRKRIAKLLWVTETEAIQWCVFLMGLHDLGKFAESFQQLRPDLRAELLPDLPIKRTQYSLRHDSLGNVVWQNVIMNKLLEHIDASNATEEFIEDIFPFWLEPVLGHHGYPPSADNERVKNHFARHDEQAAWDFVQDWLELNPVNFAIDNATVENERWKADQKKLSWLLAGFAVVCDWLGSDQRIFDFHSEDNVEGTLSLADYWCDVASVNAKKAIEKSGILPAKPSVDLSIASIFPYVKTTTPLQQACQELTFENEAQLFILEDVTGAGKTEAAILLANRLISKNLAEGLYVGLPTMATANAMYTRMADSYLNLYQQEERPSLILSHSARNLSSRFRQSILSAQTSQQNYSRDNQRQLTRDANITEQCNRWLADNRKKSLLSDVGVGTIDQALMGVLPLRHQSLRLLGLVNKVLILDEVHAYDTYTNELLKSLIQFHSALGGSIILLTATLTQNQRESLARMFCDGDESRRKFVSEKPDCYPLLTQISASGQYAEIALDTRESVKREVTVVQVDNVDRVVNLISEAVSRGQSVCWIRNTVSDARDAVELLTTAQLIDGNKVDLFHSRYTLHDRNQIEQDVLNKFGKQSTADDRKGRVLVATQVVEQSLDLDFDEMITDLAPIDLLIQRAGRLRRHNRDSQGDLLADGLPDQRGMATLHVLSPKFEEQPSEDWYKKLFPKANYVYPNTFVLWRTAKKLLELGCWHMPADKEGKRGARELLEFVYDEDNIPEGLLNTTYQQLGEKMAHKDEGQFAALKLSSGYKDSYTSWNEEDRFSTRLGEDTQSIYLARWQSGKLIPWVAASHNSWALSSLKVSKRQLTAVAKLEDPLLREAMKQLKKAELLFDQDSIILPLQLAVTTEELWSCSCHNDRGQEIQVRYCAKQGLEIVKL